MAEGEVCNFAYINVSEFFNRRNKTVSYEDLAEAAKIMVRMLDNAVEISIQNAINGNS